MPKGYLLLELTYEYNDENYYRPEAGGGSPLGVYMNKRDADLEHRAKTLDALRDGYAPLTAYSYDVTDLIKANSIGEFCTEANDKFEEHGITFTPDNIETTLEQARQEFDDEPLWQLYQMLDLPLYAVVKIDIETAGAEVD